MKVFMYYEDNEDSDLHKTLKITLPKSWKNGPTSRLLAQFVESYNSSVVLKEKNELHVDKLHLTIRRKNPLSEKSETIPLASNEIVLNCINDRECLFVVHGLSQTIQEVEEEKSRVKQQIKAQNANMVSCKRFGCNTRFPKGGPYPPCIYHSHPPIFHETAKYWSCCPNKKAYDWEEFQGIVGCQSGTCTEVEELNQKKFLGGCDLREKNNTSTLKSIDDFNKATEEGSEAAPVLERLRSVFGEIGVENELFDQVVDGIKDGISDGGDMNDDQLKMVVGEFGKKIKDMMKSAVVEQLRIK